jgi:hypothetical protein
MKHHILLRTLCTLLAVGALVPSALARLSAGEIALFGGHWSSQCGSAIAPTLRVQEDSLRFDGDGRQVTAADPVASRSHFGQNPPRDHNAVLIGQGADGSELLFIVTGVGKHAYIKVDGSPSVRKVLGQRWLDAKFQHCEGAIGVASVSDPITRGIAGR